VNRPAGTCGSDASVGKEQAGWSANYETVKNIYGKQKQQKRNLSAKNAQYVRNFLRNRIFKNHIAQKIKLNYYNQHHGYIIMRNHVIVIIKRVHDHLKSSRNTQAKYLIKELEYGFTTILGLAGGFGALDFSDLGGRPARQ